MHTTSYRVTVPRELVRTLPYGGEEHPCARDTPTAAGGARRHFAAGPRWIRPGLSYTWRLDEPSQGHGYDMPQLDVPIAF